MKIELKSNNLIAVDSNDHKFPYGTSICNSRNLRFVNKILKMFKDRNIKILDLGCSGGGFIKDCINNGCLAIGLEGSDISQKLKRQAWSSIPEFLFTCDITKDFELYNDNKKIKFDLITSWEVLEHIKKADINNLIKNIKNSLKTNGLFICSISSASEIINGIELHKTQEEKQWWINKFKEYGFYENIELYNYFNGQYINGSKKEKNSSFHLILNLNNNKINHPILSLQDKFLDKWKGSWLQNRIKYLVVGE